MDNVADNRAGGAGDNADRTRKIWDFFLMGGVKQAFGGKFLFAFFQKFEQGAGSGHFQLLNHQLVTAFAGKSGNAAGGNDFQSVFRPDRQ